MSASPLVISLRPYLPKDAPLLASIFEASIAELTGDDYSDAQQQAWIAARGDIDAFGARLARQTTLLAVAPNGVVGFASLKGEGCIDMLYVHPGAAGKGVATVLIDALERLAQGRGLKKLTVDASETAYAFFQKRGYIGVQRNSVPLDGEWLTNTTMQKVITAAGPSKVQRE